MLCESSVFSAYFILKYILCIVWQLKWAERRSHFTQENKLVLHWKHMVWVSQFNFSYAVVVDFHPVVWCCFPFQHCLLACSISNVCQKIFQYNKKTKNEKKMYKKKIVCDAPWCITYSTSLSHCHSPCA